MQNDHAVRSRQAPAHHSIATSATAPTGHAPSRRAGTPTSGRAATGGARVGAVLAGTAAAVAVWVAAVPVLGVDLLTRTGPQGALSTVAPAMVLVAGAVAGLAGWAALAVLERLRAAPRRTWTLVAVTVAVLSLIGPATSAATTAAALSLAAMHLAVGATLVPLLARTAER